MTDPQDTLTILIPSRNRPHLVAPLLRFLRRCGLRCKILLADSSDPEQAAQNRTAARGADVAYQQYPPDLSFYEKLVDALATVDTTFVVMLPDDDLPMPHAILACLSSLVEHPDYAAAWGYVLDYANHDAQLDIVRVRWFTPSIDEPSAFERIYHLVRRYQPFFWAVFRKEVLIQSILQARSAKRIVFQELTTMLTTALQGKVRRLPVVYSLRGQERSLDDRSKIEPLFAFLHNAQGFLAEYADYRNRLIAFVRRSLGADAEKQLRDCSIEQFFDLVHGIGLARELDAGSINYTVQRALGAPYPPIPHPNGVAWREPSPQDRVGKSAVPGRRYVWRHEALNAEPRSEITISAEEIRRVESQLEHYAL